MVRSEVPLPLLVLLLWVERSPQVHAGVLGVAVLDSKLPRGIAVLASILAEGMEFLASTPAG